MGIGGSRRYGIVSSSIFTIGHTLIARLYEEKRFTMMGLMDFMFSLGTFAASFFVTLLYLQEENWRRPICIAKLYSPIAKTKQRHKYKDRLFNYRTKIECFTLRFWLASEQFGLRVRCHKGIRRQG